ncbi:MAG: hypothetical protein NT093_00985, partial [Candidatus Moranbacteria bacterium]|nr:hypothetical protein [Candidatus Moranbacteria bacterium]
MDKEPKINLVSNAESEKSDPRMINGHFHENPLKVCYCIQDMIERMRRNGAKMTEETKGKMLELSEYMGYVRDAYYDIDEATPFLKEALVPREELKNTIEAIDDLIGNPQFLEAADASLDLDNPENYSLSPSNGINLEEKKDSKTLLKNYIDL